MKRFVQSHRTVIELPAERTRCEHPSLAELVECEVCQGRGSLYDPEQRAHYGVEVIPWRNPRRGRATFVEGYDR
jgi:hypothetical protein